MTSPLAGFIVSIPTSRLTQRLYLPPEKSYRIALPAGWRVVPGGEGEVQFRPGAADQGYWPGMLIAKEPTKDSVGPKEEAEINSGAAEGRENFRWVSSERIDLPIGEVYLIVYEHTFQKLRMRTAEAHLVSGGQRYWMPFNALVSTFDRHFPTYLNCLRTFAPLEPDTGWVYN